MKSYVKRCCLGVAAVFMFLSLSGAAFSATLSGTVSYSGTKTGTIYIGLFTTSNFSGAPAYGTAIASPGSYLISNIAPGTYYVASFRDTNGNHAPDSALDPTGVYVSNPKILSNNQNATGINITLTDPAPATPASISGTVFYSGTKTGTINIGLFTTSDFSGTPAYGTQIASPGSYSIPDIAPGTYYVASFRDTNSNGVWDSTLDPSGVYVSNPKILSNNQNATGINITLTDPAAGASGDINGDSAVNITDVILCLRQAIGLDTLNPALADMNGDTLVNITDVILILRKAIGLDAKTRAEISERLSG